MKIIIILTLVINLLFGSFLDEIWPLKGINVEIMNNNFNEDDIIRIKKSGMNLVVLNLKFKIYKKRYKLSEKLAIRYIFNETDRILDLLTKHEIYGIIAFTKLPIFSTKFKQTSPEFWKSSIIRNKVYDLSGQIAKRFSHRGPELLAYKFIDEPLVKYKGKKNTPPNWLRIQKKIIKSIRENDKDRYIVVTSGPGGLGRNYSNWKPLDDPYIIYGAHFFTPNYYTHQSINNEKYFGYPTVKNNKYFLEHIFYTVTSFQKKYNVPVLIGSFGVIHGAKGDLDYLSNLVDMFDENNISWAYWCYKGYKGWDINLDKSTNGCYIKLNETSSRWKLLKNKISRSTYGTSK